LYFANRILEQNHEGEEGTPYQLNRSEIFAFLYYIEQHLETIKLQTEGDEVSMWSLRDHIFKTVCANEEVEAATTIKCFITYTPTVAWGSR
jgi:hypothetical protein